MTQILQLLVFVTAIIGLIGFGFYRDKKEHAKPEDGQETFDFTQQQHSEEMTPRVHRGAAMSRLR